VFLRRSNLTERQKKRLALFDNQTATLAEWEPEVIAGLEPGDLEGIFNEDELADILGEGEAEEDDFDAEKHLASIEVPKAKRGELYLLGEHRLLCGDSTSAEDVARLMNGERGVLMNTDPPYGIDYVALKKGMPGFKFSNKVANADIENDDKTTGAALQEFLEAAIRTAVPHLADDCAFYLWHPMLTQGTFFAAAAAAAAADILIHRQIIWVKPNFVLTRSGMYHWKHELCFFGWRRGNQPPWYGEKNQTSVWELGRDDGNAHPTQKPVALFAPPIHNHTKSGEIVYEPFAGSGSQIIAAEQTGRRCYAMEIEPKYIDVIVERWQQLTGKTAILANGAAAATART